MGSRALAEDVVSPPKPSPRLLPAWPSIRYGRIFFGKWLLLLGPLSGSQQEQVPNNLNSNGTESKPKKKICCACPDTKKLRDECIVQHGEDACAKWIEAHRHCLRAEGFNV